MQIVSFYSFSYCFASKRGNFGMQSLTLDSCVTYAELVLRSASLE